MATIHRLNSDWTLTDGIIDPIRLDRPRTIYDALRRENIVPDAHYGMNIAACEWICNRTFIYEKKFDLPPSNDTERTELHFEHMYGECIVEVNGRRFDAFAPGRYDITAAVAESGNVLRVSIPPQRPAAGPLPPMGISGSVSITGTNRITVLSPAFHATDRLSALLLIDAHISGKYHFTCVLSREGEAVASYELHKRLIASLQSLELEFPLPENASGMYEVQLTIELNGLLCDRLRDWVCITPQSEPDALCALCCDSDSEEQVLRLLPLLKGAGFDAVSISEPVGLTRRVATRLQELSLTQAPFFGDHPAFIGCMDADMLRKYAGGQRCWPDDAPVWKLRRDSLPGDLPMERTFGAIAADDPEKMTTAVRLLQAQQIFDHIIHARAAGEMAEVCMDVSSFPHFASAALFDQDIPRPALYAAKQALQPLVAVTDLPDSQLPCGQVLKFPVLLLSRRDTKPLPVTVTATMYAPNGSILSGTSFSAIPGGEKRLGDLNCELPKGLRHALLRIVVEQPDKAPVITERWIACGDEPMTPTALPATAVIDGRNGDQLAYGVVTEQGIRCLLPGEAVEGFTGEYFNR